MHIIHQDQVKVVRNQIIKPILCPNRPSVSFHDFSHIKYLIGHLSRNNESSHSVNVLNGFITNDFIFPEEILSSSICREYRPFVTISLYRPRRL